MQHDDIIWDTIMYRNECAFRKRSITQDFCKNPYNLTGLCTRKACPLANSQYCTVREDEGKLYLYMKTIERAHTPKKLWERVQLSPKLDVAMKQLAENLIYWPSYFQKKFAKVRLVRLYQMINRIRRIRSDPDRIQYFAVNRKRDKVEGRREAKALRASEVNEAIRTELLNRLQSKTYGSIYDTLTNKKKTEQKEFSLRNNDDLTEADLEESDVDNFVEAYDGEDYEEDMDMEDMGEYEYEYEYENERAPRQRVKEAVQDKYVAYDDEFDDDVEAEEENAYDDLDDDAGFEMLMKKSSEITKPMEVEEKKSSQAVKAALSKLSSAPIKPILRVPSKAPTSLPSKDAEEYDDEEEEEEVAQEVVVKKSSIPSKAGSKMKARSSKK